MKVGSSVTHTAVLGFSCPSAHELRVPLSVFQFIKTGLYDVAETGSAIGMQNWHFFYVDERCVPFTSDDSNHNNAQILYQRV